MRMQPITLSRKYRGLAAALVALAIALVFFLVAPALQPLNDNTPRRKTETGLLALATVLRDYESRFGSFPESLSSAGAAMNLSESSLRSLQLDGWGNEFVYQRNPQGPPTVYSLGPNGRDDGRGLDDVQIAQDYGP